MSEEALNPAQFGYPKAVLLGGDPKPPRLRWPSVMGAARRLTQHSTPASCPNCPH